MAFRVYRDEAECAHLYGLGTLGKDHRRRAPELVGGLWVDRSGGRSRWCNAWTIPTAIRIWCYNVEEQSPTCIISPIDDEMVVGWWPRIGSLCLCEWVVLMPKGVAEVSEEISYVEGPFKFAAVDSMILYPLKIKTSLNGKLHIY